MPPTGTLQGEIVTVTDDREANALYNKGYFGYPQSGGGLDLDLLEAVYLAEMNRLAVEDEHGMTVTPAELLVTASAREDAFAVRYVVYRDLRQRGFVVRASNVTDFNVYPRGAVLGKQPSKHLVRALSERTAFDPAAVAAQAERSRELKKTLLLAIVDEEGDLTYYDVDQRPPRGKAPPAPLDLSDAPPAYLLADRVVVTDDASAARLGGRHHLGRGVGPALQLSLVEALWLVDEAGLAIVDTDARRAGSSEALTRDEVADAARGVEADFDLRYALYRDLVGQGLIVKTGFKYGTHFRAYEGNPDEEHAPFLIHALPEDATLPWPDVAGFVRLAHGVRKSVHFRQGDEYMRLKRTRP